MLIYLIRHAQTEWNLAGRWQGSSDIPLDETGRRQARALAKRMRMINAGCFYSSRLQRAAETTEIICGGKPLILREGLHEIVLGSWEGMTYSEICEAFGGDMEKWETDPNVSISGIENYISLQNRALHVIESIAGQETGDFAIVTHGAFIKAFVCYVLGMDLNKRQKIETANTGITVFEYSKREFTLKTLNDVSHLMNFEMN